jgi:osmotically-inducible protein OsmY
LAAALLALCGGWRDVVAAGESVAGKGAPVATVVVTAKRSFDPVADAATTVRVQAAFHEDPYIFDEHVTVVTVDGVVYLEGIVFDDWDLTRILRLARRLAGGRRIVNQLEWGRGGSD